MNLLKSIGGLAFTTTTLTAYVQQLSPNAREERNAHVQGNVQWKCPNLRTLRMRTECGSEIVVLLQMWIFGQDPWTDVY